MLLSGQVSAIIPEDEVSHSSTWVRLWRGAEIGFVLRHRLGPRGTVFTDLRFLTAELPVTSSDASIIANGSEDQFRSKYLHFRGSSPSRPLVLALPSTPTVPATRKTYYASLQEERFAQTASQHPRLSTRTSIGFARLDDPGQVQAGGGGCRKADIRTQGHGRSVQGDEVAASSDVQH